MATQGIPETSPIRDGQPGQDSWSSTQDRTERDTRERRLLSGKDEVAITPPVRGSRAIFRECLMRGVQQALGVPKTALLRPYPQEWVQDTGQFAERLCSEVGAMLQQAIALGVEKPERAVEKGAAAGVTQAMEILEKLGLLDGPAGPTIQELLTAWGEHLVRLTETRSDEH